MTSSSPTSQNEERVIMDPIEQTFADNANCKENTQVNVFGVDLSRFTKPQQLLICSLGIFGSYILYSIMQEYLFVAFKFDKGFFLTLVQFSCYSGLAFAHRKVVKEGERKAPMRVYLIIALFSTLTMSLTNHSLQYLNYPTQILFKSCKLLVVMLAGFWFKKRYSALDYSAAGLLVFGLIILSMPTDEVGSIELNRTGVILVSSGLLVDAFVGNTQDHILSTYNSPPSEVIAYSYGVGASYLFLLCLANGELKSGIEYCAAQPGALMTMLIFATCGYVGSEFFMTTVKIFGVFVAVTCTSVRKVMTLMLSFLVFPKPLTSSFAFSSFLIFCGLGVNIYSKNKATINAILSGKKITQLSSYGNNASTTSLA